MTYNEKRELYESIMKQVSKKLKDLLNEDKKKYDGLSRRQRSALKRDGVNGNYKYKSEKDLEILVRRNGHHLGLYTDEEGHEFPIRGSFQGQRFDTFANHLKIENNMLYLVCDNYAEIPFRYLKDNVKKDFIKWFNETYHLMWQMPDYESQDENT